MTQINKHNVSKLKIAWEDHTGDISDGRDGRPKSEFETTPVVVGGTLYFTTPFNRVIALDPENGKEKWSFDPHIDQRRDYSEGLVNRSVSIWTDSGKKAGEPCHRRIFLATIDARLFSIDAAGGKACADFGNAGQIDLKSGIPNIVRSGEYEETSPPAVVGDLVIVGFSIADNDRVASPSGIVRAFDARSGKLRWSWNRLPESLAPTGAGNAWSTISVDSRLHRSNSPCVAGTESLSSEERGAADWIVALLGKVHREQLEIISFKAEVQLLSFLSPTTGPTQFR